MDPDSFFTHLFPDFDEFDCRYTSSQPYDQPFLTAQNFGITNIDTKIPTDVDPLEKSVPRSVVNNSFSSVLKLSDIACVLEKFSKPSLCSEFLYPTPAAAHDQLEPAFHSSLTKHIPSPESKRPKLLQSSDQIRSNINDASKADNVDGARKRINKDGLSQREIHIQAERQRRKSMADYFTILQSLVPKLRVKHADRITVLTELIAYIQSLRGTMKELDEKKADLLTTLGLSEEDCHYASQEHWNGCMGLLSDLNQDLNQADRKPHNHNIQLPADSLHAQVTVRISGADVFVNLTTPKQKGAWPKVLLFLQRYNIEVVNATFATSGENNFHCIHGKVVNISKVSCFELQERLQELIFKELNKRPKL